MADVAASALLPVLIDEIRRLKELHSLAAGVTELPVKDAVVREELAQLRSDFTQIKALLGGAGAMVTASRSNHAPTAEARKDEAKPSAFGQAAQPADAGPPTRPRMNSVKVSGMLPLPEGCETHFFLVSNNRSTNEIIASFAAAADRLLHPKRRVEPLPGDGLGSGRNVGIGAAAARVLVMARQQSRGSHEGGQSLKITFSLWC